MTDVTPSMTKVEAGGTLNAPRAEIQGVGLFIAIAAIGLSLLSTGLWIATVIFWPQIVDAKIKAAVAPSYALAELARKEASTAKDATDLEIQRRKAREELSNGKR